MKLIAFIEDDMCMRALLKNFFKNDLSYTVFFNSLADFNNYFASENYRRPDIIVSDYNLNDGNGLQVANKVKGLDIPLIFFSGYPLRFHKSRMKDLNIKSVVTKSSGVSKLINEIKESLKWELK